MACTPGASSTDAAATNTDLLSSTDTAGGGNLLTDLVSVFDPAAAGDSGNLLTDLLSLF